MMFKLITAEKNGKKKHGLSFKKTDTIIDKLVSKGYKRITVRVIGGGKKK